MPQKITLGVIASLIFKYLQLLLCFDPLGDSRYIHLMSKSDNTAHEPLIFKKNTQTQYKTAINFKSLETETPTFALVLSSMML